jgi:hypothetical protein
MQVKLQRAWSVLGWMTATRYTYVQTWFHPRTTRLLLCMVDVIVLPCSIQGKLHKHIKSFGPKLSKEGGSVADSIKGIYTASLESWIFW